MQRPKEIGERSAVGEAYLRGELRQAPLRGELRLSRREDVQAIDELPSAERRAAVDRAAGALRAGKVAFGLLAAGASTRMNLAEIPPSAARLLERAGRRKLESKALVPVTELGGRVLSFLDLYLENVARLSRETTSACPSLLLVSEANAEEIEGQIRASGLVPAELLVVFRQKLDRQIVATAEDVLKARKNFASDADVASAEELGRAFAGAELAVPKPAGHGEFLHQMISSGTLGRLLARGVEWIGIRNIDNVGAVYDERWLAILGRMIGSGKNFTLEVSRRPDGPAGKGGALILRPGGELQIAEDPAFAGTGKEPRDSYYINNAVAIMKVDYLFRIYETSAAELRAAAPSDLAAIADRGRRKFPPLLDVKPVRLAGGAFVGAFVRETNLWESTGVAAGLGVDAAGVLSVKDVEEGFASAPPEEQRARALRVRFVATKKWEDYEGINAALTPHLARKVVEGPLFG